MTVVTAQMGLEARNNLTTIVNHWPHLQAALRPATSSALTGMPHHAAQNPAPINLHVSDLMHEIETWTRDKAAELLADTDDWQPTTTRMPALLNQIAGRYGHWTAADTNTALTFTDTAHHYANQVTNALTPPTRPTYIGPCPIPECEGELTIREGTTTTTCPVCTHDTTLDQQKEWLEEQFEDHLVTRAEIIPALKILGLPKSKQVIHDWIKNEHLLPAIPDEDLYRISDAQLLALRTRGRPRKTSA